MSVPTANMEEIIPAARLLSRATALTSSDYERAKSAFLSGMDASGLAAQVTGYTQPTLLLLSLSRQSGSPSRPPDVACCTLSGADWVTILR